MLICSFLLVCTAVEFAVGVEDATLGEPMSKYTNRTIKDFEKILHGANVELIGPSPSKYCYTIFPLVDDQTQSRFSKWDANYLCNEVNGSLPDMSPNTKLTRAEFDFWTEPLLKHHIGRSWLPHVAKPFDNKVYTSPSGDVITEDNVLWTEGQPDMVEQRCIIAMPSNPGELIKYGLDDIECSQEDLATVAVCQHREGCQVPPLLNATHSTPFVSYGDRIIYSCHEGMEMKHPYEMTCTCQGIKLKGEKPDCIPMLTAGAATIRDEFAIAALVAIALCVAW